LADLLRSAGEFFAILLSWCVIVQVARNDDAAYNYGLGKLEQLASLVVATALFASFVVVFGTGFTRLLHPEPLENPYFGLVFAVLGTLGNGFVWMKDFQICQRSPSPVMEAQWKLFRAKTIATAIVVLTLGTSVVSTNSALALYLDPIGSLVLALFLLHSSYSMVTVRSMRKFNSLYSPPCTTIRSSTTPLKKFAAVALARRCLSIYFLASSLIRHLKGYTNV
jgi:divalent metal cation (Fe/Co/Zn/Cd) transporter